MTTRPARLASPRSSCPTSACPTREPEIPHSIYAARLEAARARWRRAATTACIVYADREHSANLAWLTGFDPRFEEALLVVGPDGDPRDPRRQRVLRAWPAQRRCRCAAHLFQDLSLPGQPRDRSRPLATRSSATKGSGRGARVGVVGWKTYADRDLIDVPAYHRRRAARPDRPDRAGRERRRPADRPGRRAAGHQRGRAAGDARVGGLPDIERGPPAALRPAAGA